MIRRRVAGTAVVEVVVVAAALVTITSSVARAVSPAAEALFQEGRRLLAAGQTDEACVRFAESYAAEASSGTLLNLALCHEKQGRTATAWAEYRGAARLARHQGREDRARAADDKIAMLEAKLPRLISVPAKPVPGLQIATEEGTLGEGGLGVAVPVDPGLHNVRVSAPGYRPWATIVEMKEGEQRTLEIPELDAEPVPAAIPAPVTAPAVVVGSDADVRGNAAPERSAIPIAVLGSLGVVGLAAGAVFALRYQSENGEAKTLCPLNVCRDQLEKDHHESLLVDARRDLTIGFVVSGTAGAVLLAAAYLWWRSGPPRPVRRAVDSRISARLFAPARGVGGDIGFEW